MRLVQNSLRQEAACTLQEQLFLGALAPGSFIDKITLCAMLKISRTPRHEAPKGMNAEGLLSSQRSGLAS